VPGNALPVQIRQLPSGWLLENGWVAVEIALGGVVTSVKDLRANREILAGLGNELHLLRDYPNRWSAWDIEGSAMEDFEIVGAGGQGRIIEQGKLRVVLEFIRNFGKSSVTQRIVLCAGSSRLDFETTVDWQERDRVLKVSFPLAIHSDHAVCEIQFGSVRRPVHRNTSWDAARFEIPVQRWIDLSEADYGVAILNNGTFGCDVLGNRIRLTLLKGASAPDPVADMGIHRRTFSLYPHAGCTLEGKVVETALALNCPLLVSPGRPRGSTEQSWFSVDRPAVTLEALKRSEDGSDLVMRWIEAGGRQTRVSLKTSLPGLEFKECDLLERPLELGSEPGDFEMRPFDIRSFCTGKS
jgi:alpha-mannosidase